MVISTVIMDLSEKSTVRIGVILDGSYVATWFVKLVLAVHLVTWDKLNHQLFIPQQTNRKLKFDHVSCLILNSRV